jgi:hypothetical protein
VRSQLRPLRNACDDFWLQHNYQWVGRLGREELAMALRQAEDVIASHLGFSLLPTWVKAEEQTIDFPPVPEMAFTDSMNLRGKMKSVYANWGYLQSAGIKGTTLIQAGVAVVYNDGDGDGYKETATVVVPTTVTDPDEISTFYPSKSAADVWEIRPTTVTIAGGNATIVFRREMAVLESLQEQLNEIAAGQSAVTVDGDDDANFLTTVDVYRTYNDRSQQVIFYTEGGCDSCDGSGCAVCGYTAETGCLLLRDSRLGEVAYNRADWDSVTQSYNSAAFSQGFPDKMKLYYRAGLRDESQALPNRQMHPLWERFLVFYSLTLMDTEVSSCEATRRIVSHMRTDMALQRANSENWQVSDELLNCPLGTSRAGWQLWQQIKRDRLVRRR